MAKVVDNAPAETTGAQDSTPAAAPSPSVEMVSVSDFRALMGQVNDLKGVLLEQERRHAAERDMLMTIITRNGGEVPQPQLMSRGEEIKRDQERIKQKLDEIDQGTANAKKALEEGKNKYEVFLNNCERSKLVVGGESEMIARVKFMEYYSIRNMIDSKVEIIVLQIAG